jgi:hypothetical protein
MTHDSTTHDFLLLISDVLEQLAEADEKVLYYWP